MLNAATAILAFRAETLDARSPPQFLPDAAPGGVHPRASLALRHLPAEYNIRVRFTTVVLPPTECEN
jgi:hypothetical protein